MDVFKLTNWINYTSLFRDKHSCCRDTVLPEYIEEKQNGMCRIREKRNREPYNYHLCLFQASAPCLIGNKKLEEELSRFFNHSLITSKEVDVSKLRCAYMNKIPKVEDWLRPDPFLIDFDCLDGKLIKELLVDEPESLEETSNSYDKMITFATSTISIPFSKFSLAVHVIKSFPKLVT